MLLLLANPVYQNYGQDVGKPRVLEILRIHTGKINGLGN